MDLKAHNIGDLFLHGKEKEAPMSLTTADVARIQILLDFISTGSKLHGGPIMALVHILVDILDGLDRGNGLYIDVTAISPDEVLGVADN
jgi:hypothetical protein